MQYGTIFKANVIIGTLELGVCEVITGTDGTMTVKFHKGELTNLDEVFNSSPLVSIDGEEEVRHLQAYRVESNGNVEVSFLTNFAPLENTLESIETVGEAEESEVLND